MDQSTNYFSSRITKVCNINSIESLHTHSCQSLLCNSQRVFACGCLLTEEHRVTQTAWTHFKVTINRAPACTHANISLY